VARTTASRLPTGGQTDDTSRRAAHFVMSARFLVGLPPPDAIDCDLQQQEQFAAVAAALMLLIFHSRQILSRGGRVPA